MPEMVLRAGSKKKKLVEKINISFITLYFIFSTLDKSMIYSHKGKTYIIQQEKPFKFINYI